MVMPAFSDAQTHSSLRFSVSDFNLLFKQMVEADGVFSNIWIEGEICQLKPTAYGNQRYLSLTDGKSFLSCVFYDTLLKRCDFSPQNGQKVAAKGKLVFFQKRGQVVFQIQFLSLAGDGALAQQLHALKARLTAEGLFSPDRKQPLPRFPESIVLITANHSAALSDFISISNRSFPHIALTLIPSLMQGNDCSGAICQALKQSALLQPDLTVIFRGGGSAQDLAPFHDEALVRAVCDYPFPVMSAVGHELDYHLIDFAADYRAATPTAAAQAIATPFDSLLDFINQRVRPLPDLLSERCDSLQEKLCDFIDTGYRFLGQHLSTYQDHFHHLIQRLDFANPIKRFDDGFSICKSTQSGQVLRSIEKINKNDVVNITFSDGQIDAIVSSVYNDKAKKRNH